MTARTMSEGPGARRPYHHHYQQPRYPTSPACSLASETTPLSRWLQMPRLLLARLEEDRQPGDPLFPGCHLTAGPRNRPTRLDKETSPFQVQDWGGHSSYLPAPSFRSRKAHSGQRQATVKRAVSYFSIKTFRFCSRWSLLILNVPTGHHLLHRAPAGECPWDSPHHGQRA